MNLNLTSKISRSPDVAFTQIDDDLVMMGSEDGLFYGVNSVGTEIWSLLEFKTLSLSDICSEIQQNYDVTEEQCLEDSKQFITAMVEKKMLIVA